MAVRIRVLEDGTAGAWDAFVRAAPQASFFHLSPWRRVIGEAFGHTTHYALAEQDGAVVGVLPLARMRTRLFGDLLASTPFCVYGGPVAASPEAAAALESHALDLQRRLGAPCLEFRRLDAADPGWEERPPLYFTFRKPIAVTGDDAADMQRNIPRKQRAEVRKAIERFRLTSVSDGDTDGLHRVYAESVRNLGSPVFPRRYFRLLGAAFPREHDVTTVLHEGRPGYANYYFNRQHQSRLEEGLKEFAGWDGRRGTWKFSGVTDANQTFRVLLAEQSVGMWLDDKPYLQPLDAVDWLDEPPGTGGLLVAFQQFKWLVSEGPEAFTEFAYFGSEPLDGRGPLVDVLLTERGTLGARWYFRQSDGALIGYDSSLLADQDECRIRFVETVAFSGLRFPATFSVSSGDKQLGVFKVQQVEPPAK